MPKRGSIDISTAPGTASGALADRALRKTERSHEENQERAYIAASRRADRSIEARLQSARMASDIHKKRTGKGFKITEEIVIKEEMYEEEEDEFPRQYRALTGHFHTGSSDFASRLNAYVSSNVAMRSLAWQQEIDRKFAEQFPGASTMSQYTLPLEQQFHQQRRQQQQQQQHHQQQQQQQHGSVHSFANYTAPVHHRTHSIPDVRSTMQNPAKRQNTSPAVHHSPIETAVSPSALSGSDTSRSTPTPVNQDYSMTYSPTPSTAATLDSPMSYAPPASSGPFTSELPNELKMMTNLDWTDPMTPALLGIHGGELIGTDDDNSWMNYLNTTSSAPFDSTIPARDDQQLPPQDYFNTTSHPVGHFPDIPGQRSTIGTPGGGVGGEEWDKWVNVDAYAPEEHR